MKRGSEKPPIPPRLQLVIAILFLIVLILTIILYVRDLLQNPVSAATTHGLASLAAVAGFVPAPRSIFVLRLRGRPARTVVPRQQVENTIAALWHKIEDSCDLLEAARRGLEDELYLMVQLHLMRNGFEDVPGSVIRAAVRRAVYGEDGNLDTTTLDLADIVQSAVNDVEQEL